MSLRKLAILVGSLSILGVLLVSGCGSMASEDKYPTKQVTYLLTFDPGGQSDREARRQQPHLEAILGQKITIDYKAGGGGALGWAECARTKPDGYTMCGFNLPPIITQPLQQDVGYKTDDLVPIVTFQATPMVLMVQNSSPWRTLKEYLDVAKKSPGKMNIGGTGTWGASHITAVMLQKLSGAKVEYVPFNGNATLATALLGGHVNVAILNTDDAVKYANETRSLAITSADRFPQLSSVPTLKESGYDFVEGAERGVAVPKGTPDSIVKKLEKAFLDTVTKPEVVESMTKEGMIPLARNSADSKAYISKLTERYKGIAEEIKGSAK